MDADVDDAAAAADVDDVDDVEDMLEAACELVDVDDDAEGADVTTAVALVDEAVVVVALVLVLLERRERLIEEGDAAAFCPNTPPIVEIRPRLLLYTI